MTPEALGALMQATWPSERVWREGPFLMADGAGGGKRVSAASLADAWAESDLALLEAMAEPLVLVRTGDERLDAALDARGWRVVDPVVIYAVPVGDLLAGLPPLAAFPHWPPLQIARAIWEDGGVGPARVAVMERVAGRKVAILARLGDRPAGVGFVARHGEEAMLHALEIRAPLRRRGVGSTILHAAAAWAAEQGAARLSLATTARNTAACALYARHRMQVVGQYHYRMK